MAFYSEDLVDEILASTDIVEVINEYVPLKRRGANYIGLCPFHKEKTPSFTVSPDKGIYKCFGCGQGGSVIQFVSKLEKLDFKETLETLAERANIDLKRYEIKSGYNDEKNDLKEKIERINKDSARYFYEALTEQVKMENSPLKAYLKKRQLDMKTVVRFGLGFGSKQNETLVGHLTKLGYSKEDILIAGVVSKNMRGEIYENFSARLIFPIMDTRDRVIGFGGRVLDNSLPKYVNSPENALYHKGNTLYGLNVARKEKLDEIIVVEGYMDCVALHKSGIVNAVASLGTALTERQAKLIKKYTTNVVISYDQDNAGQNATLRAIDILSKEDLKVKVLKLDHTDVKDPDEYINKYGKANFETCVKNSIPAVMYKITRLENLLDKDDFDQKVDFLTKVASILAEIGNDIEIEMYVDIISKKYKISRDAILSEIGKRLGKENKKKSFKLDKQEQKMDKNLSLRKKQEEYIVALLLSKDKKTINDVFKNFDENDFEFEDIKNIYLFLKKISEDNDISKLNILAKVNENDDIDINVLTEIIAIDINSFNKEKLVIDLCNTFKKYSYQKRRKEILKRLEENISDDEKQMLEVELGQIVIRLAKMK